MPVRTGPECCSIRERTGKASAALPRRSQRSHLTPSPCSASPPSASLRDALRSARCKSAITGAGSSSCSLVVCGGRCVVRWWWRRRPRPPRRPAGPPGSTSAPSGFGSLASRACGVVVDQSATPSSGLSLRGSVEPPANGQPSDDVTARADRGELARHVAGGPPPRGGGSPGPGRGNRPVTAHVDTAVASTRREQACTLATQPDRPQYWCYRRSRSSRAYR